MPVYFLRLGNVSAIISSNMLSFCFSSSAPQNMNLNVLDVVLEVLQVFLLYFHLFFFPFSYLSSMISTTLSSRLQVHSSVSHNLLIPSGVFFISVIIYLMLVCCLFSNCSLFFVSSFLFSALFGLILCFILNYSILPFLKVHSFLAGYRILD